MDTLMKDQSQKSPLQIWKDSHNVTSSVALGGGQELCKLQEYPQQPSCGRDHHHANHSVQQGNKRENLMRDISPQHFCDLSRSVDLQLCLANRLQRRLMMGGSMIFMLSWKNRATQSGLPFCQLVSSVRRTNVNDFSSGQLAAWLTPTVTNIGARSPEAMKKRMAQRAATGRKSLSPGNLLEQIKMYWGPGTIADSIYAEMGNTDTLNPQFPCWLMGFPLQWDDCGVSAMQ